MANGVGGGADGTPTVEDMGGESPSRGNLTPSPEVGVGSCGGEKQTFSPAVQLLNAALFES